MIEIQIYEFVPSTYEIQILQLLSLSYLFIYFLLLSIHAVLISPRTHFSKQINYLIFFTAEIVDIENPDAARTPVYSRTDGVLFSRARHKLARAGHVIAKVAGQDVLEWRKGNLLTA